MVGCIIYTGLSWLQPSGRPPSEEPFWEQEEQEDFRGDGCHRLMAGSMSSGATASNRVIMIVILCITQNDI